MTPEKFGEAAENELRKQSWDTTITLPYNQGYIKGFQQGAEWQAEKRYSEEEVKRLVFAAMDYKTQRIINFSDKLKWFEEFKKK